MEFAQPQIMDFIPMSQRENFETLMALGEELSLKIKIERSKKGDSIKYTMKEKNRNLFSLKGNGRTLEIKPALWHLDAYRDTVEQQGDSIKSVIVQARACKNCSDRCGGGARFTLDGTEHYKCLFSGFTYANPAEEDVETLCQLITMEHDGRRKT
ncbi:hypothetical protein RFF05_05480 [Bengtsoniella intestinalis]|uniref:hypothetical protein n=1 Tax=Bengtsoniella intestinalis TaxID=3073143 RepID=UPI00391F49AD